MPASENIYVTPTGKVDLPFLYVFDGSTLTDGQSFPTLPSLHVPIQWDSDFILRAILGVPTVVNPTTGGFRLYNYSGGLAMGDFIKPMSNQFAVVPEKFYPRNGVVKFDLATVLRAFNACGESPIYKALIAFQGVKRYTPGSPGYASGGPQLPAPTDPDSYVPRPWTYPFQLNLNWFARVTAGGLPEIPRTFTIAIQDYDFELHYISVVNLVTGARVTVDLFQIMLYDATAKRQLFSQPVNASFLDNNRKEYGNPVFPVPPLLFPVWTQIRFDISSLVCNTDVSAPYAFQVDFVGVNRVPKVGPQSGKQASSGVTSQESK